MINNDFLEIHANPVVFTNEIHNRIKVEPMYYQLGFSPSPDVFGRLIVLKQLIKALSLLPEEYGFVIWDIYRPRSIQEKLFNWMRDEIRKKSPQLSDEENYSETRKFMSPPSSVGDSYCAPHLSGGAVDLSLFSVSHGHNLDMGTIFDDCTDKAHRDYFNLKGQLLAEEENIKSRRNILRAIMEQVGFTSYEHEWWHFDIGNIFWARELNRTEMFGPLFGDNEWPKDKVFLRIRQE
jgi:D-alanyl-D-alanine dipeptidase